MTYPFGSPDFYGRSRNPAAEFGASRVVLVALDGDLVPSIFYQSRPLQRTRVTLVPENQPDEWEPSDAPPENFRRPLPALPRVSASPPPAPMRARLVRGEILRDQQGRLYENIAGTIRPVGNLFSGPRGEVLELAPSERPHRGEAQVEADAQVTADPAGERAKTQDRARPDDSRQPERSRNFPERQKVEEPEAANRTAAPYRQLFADPGEKRIVQLGDFKAMLTPQLAHSERLRDAHRLACYLQVYESTKAQPLAAMAAAALGNATVAGQLQLVNEPVARVLGLGGLPRTRPAMPPNFRRQPGVILPNERVFRLRLAQDPTADAPLTDVPPNPQVKAAMPSMAHEQTTSLAAQRKNSIPERFIKPWEFKLTREEALHDMNVAMTFGASLATLGRRLTAGIANRGQLRKWQHVLRGKHFEDQLWGMPPPKGALVHPKARQWAMNTLELAGYEPHAMLLEWEIFWRRKGA